MRWREAAAGFAVMRILYVVLMILTFRDGMFELCKVSAVLSETCNLLIFLYVFNFGVETNKNKPMVEMEFE